MKFVLLTPDQKLAEIKRLYYQTTAHTIEQDLAKALDLLKSMAKRAAVYMDGLSQMRSDWSHKGKSEKEKGKRSKSF